MKKFIQNKMMGVSAMVAVGLMTGVDSAHAAGGAGGKSFNSVAGPGNAKLKDGVIYLAIGGALFAVPIITTAMFELIDPAGSGVGAVTSKVKAVEFGVN